MSAAIRAKFRSLWSESGDPIYAGSQSCDAVTLGE